MRTYNILIVEDEWSTSQFLTTVVEELGHKVIASAISANEALEIAKNNTIDLVFMDINIEGVVNGITCANLLNQQQNIPVIFTTAYKDTKTIQSASKTNIYGYLIKPFDENDVEASLSVALLRAYGSNESHIQTLQLGSNSIYHFETNTLMSKNIPIVLTHKESQVLNFFCLNINQNITYDMLREHVWQNKEIGDSNIRDTISRLRKKAPQLSFSNSAGLGYCLKNT